MIAITPKHLIVIACGATVLGLGASLVHAQPASAPVAVQMQVGIPHVVRQGESLPQICRHYRIAQAQCQQLAADGSVQPGQTVYVPLQGQPYQSRPARLLRTVGSVRVNGKPGQAGARLNENSRIETAADSSALVELADGSRVKMMPKTVADIVHNRHYRPVASASGAGWMNWFAGKMRLTQGAIEALVDKVAPRAQPLEVETATSLIGVRGTHFRVSAADDYVRADRAEVLQGQVHNANTWKRSAIALHAGHGAVVDPNVADIQAVPLLPAPAISTPNQRMRLPQTVWTFPAVSGARAYRVIAARDAAFENISYSELVASPAVDLSRLGLGKWYMRVRGVDTNGLEGYDGDVMLDILQPTWSLGEISIQADIHGRAVLSWGTLRLANRQAIPGVSTLRIELDRSPDFATAQQWQLHARAKQLILPAITQGVYYLRISVENPMLDSKEQQTYRFAVPLGFRHDMSNILLQRVQG